MEWHRGSHGLIHRQQAQSYQLVEEKSAKSMPQWLW